MTDSPTCIYCHGPGCDICMGRGDMVRCPMCQGTAAVGVSADGWPARCPLCIHVGVVGNTGHTYVSRYAMTEYMAGAADRAEAS